MRLIFGVKLPPKEAEAVLKAVSEGKYMNYSDLLRVAVRRELERIKEVA